MCAMPEPHTPRHKDHTMGNRVVCATPRRGKGLSNYSLGDRLGKGAFATVFKAIHLKTARVAAVKQIPLEKIDSVDTIMEEIELLQDLKHPNIVKYLGFMKDEIHLNIVLEYCENGSLAMILHKFGRFPENLVAQYMRQVLEGLAYLHHQGIIHRDIKGANILTTKDGVAKLGDFGVAMRIKSEQTERPRAAGTPHFMAPEIIQMQEPSTACDIWSLGATIVELKTGSPPYGDRQDIPAMYAIVQQEFSAIIPTDASGSLKDFLTLCFEKNPALRVSANDLLQHLWIRKFGEVERGDNIVTYPEQAVKEWNSSSRRKRLAVPSKLNLKDGMSRSRRKVTLSNEEIAVAYPSEETYEHDFATLGVFGDQGRPQAVRAISLNCIQEGSQYGLGPPSNKRKHLSDFIESSLTADDYEDDFDAGSLNDVSERPIKRTTYSEGTKVDPFLGLEDLLEDGPDEKLLLAQQEATELAVMLVKGECDLEIAFKRLNELILSIPSVRKTLDQSRLLPKALTILSRPHAMAEVDTKAKVAFLQLVNSCICVDKSSDFITNFCIAGGLSFVLAQFHIAPSLVLHLLFNMSDLSYASDDKLAIARQLAYREDAIAVVCSFFVESSKPNDLLSASNIILDIFKVCGARRKANLWHHFNAHGLFSKLVGLLHLPFLLSDDPNNRVAQNFYDLLVSFSRNPQELLVEVVDHRILRRLMRAFIKLNPGNSRRLILLEFFKTISSLASILDSMQKGNVAPHLIAALRRALHDDRIADTESQCTANCLVPALFNYSRINRYRQREVARYGLLDVLQDCVQCYPHLREFAFPIFSALVHADHDECWKALWNANAIESFIELINEPGWQAMAIAAVAAWILAQPNLVGPRFVPRIWIINDSLLSSTGSTFESILSAVSSLLYQNRYLCREIPIQGLFEALHNYISTAETNLSSASLVQALQIVLWVLTAQTREAAKELRSQGMVEALEALSQEAEIPVPCVKLIGQITTIMRVAAT